MGQPRGAGVVTVPDGPETFPGRGGQRGLPTGSRRSRGVYGPELGPGNLLATVFECQGGNA